MAHIGIFCPPVPSHLHLNSVVGRALRRRGHRVTLFQLPELRARVEALGLDFLPLEDNDVGTDELGTAVSQLGQMTGIAALRFTVDCARRLVHLVCRTAPDALQTSGVQLVLVDQNEPAGATVAEHLGLPFISVCNGLPLNREPRVPPPFVPWSFSDTWWAEWRNRLAYLAFDRLLAPVNRALNVYRRQWGLPLVRRPDDTFSQLAQLCPLTPDFDFPRREKPANFHYLGPLRDHSGPEIPFPYERLNGKRLVYASLGTLQNRTESSFQSIAAAVAELDVQLVISAGGGLALAEGSLPGSPIVVGYAPQPELLSRASLCITHAGLNTVLESLSFGTPMVAVPITNDQPANAARVRWSGSGELVPFPQLGTSRFRNAVQAVLENPSYRQNAKRLQESIQRSGGVEAAADVVEQTFAIQQRLPA